MNLQTFSLPMKLLKLMQSMNLQTPQQLSTLNLFQFLSQINVSSTKVHLNIPIVNVNIRLNNLKKNLNCNIIYNSSYFLKVKRKTRTHYNVRVPL